MAADNFKACEVCHYYGPCLSSVRAKGPTGCEVAHAAGVPIGYNSVVVARRGVALVWLRGRVGAVTSLEVMARYGITRKQANSLLALSGRKYVHEYRAWLPVDEEGRIFYNLRDDGLGSSGLQ